MPFSPNTHFLCKRTMKFPKKQKRILSARIFSHMMYSSCSCLFIPFLNSATKPQDRNAIHFRSLKPWNQPIPPPSFVTESLAVTKLLLYESEIKPIRKIPYRLSPFSNPHHKTLQFFQPYAALSHVLFCLACL